MKDFGVVRIFLAI